VERHVKERLIGAAVLVAAAIILIPEMLSGTQPAPTPGQQTLTLPSAGSTPGQAATADAVQGTRGTAPLKTYTIDLSRTPSQTAGSSSVAATGDALEDRAPPAELPPVSGSSPSEEASAGQVNPESTTPAPVSAAAASPSTTATGAAAPPARTSAAGTPASSAGVPATVTKSTVTAKPVEVEDGGGAWAIQMGSFSSRATAERMVKQLRDSGQQAFVMPVKSGSKTLYRVRVGPMQDKQAAQQLLGKLKSVAAGARLVPHP
jgi:DedD protein